MPPFPPLTLILASTPSLGIGFRGSLPWPLLKSELAFFARVTKRAPPPSAPPQQSSTSAQQSPVSPQPPSTSQPSSASPQQSSATPKTTNAVLMGRKTWSSLPPTKRPLRDRINVIITRDPASLLATLPSPPSTSPSTSPPPIIVAPSIEAGLQELQSTLGSALGRVFVIGGAEIYALALGMEACERVLWTRLEGEWECDVWFPGGVLGGDGEGRGVDGKGGVDGDGRRWIRREDGVLEWWCGEGGVGGRKEEGGVGWRVEMWEKEGERKRDS